jgi:hypothetical protein
LHVGLRNQLRYNKLALIKIDKENTMAKNIIQNKVVTEDNIEFTVQKVAGSEEDILIVFAGVVDHKVVKLDVADPDLPRTDNGKKITWINDFGIMDKDGNEYLDQVSYSIFLPPRANGQFIYQDRGGLKKNKTPGPGNRPDKPGWVKVEFDTGDPAVGWT